ncbi:MAG TPA: tRNA lysidine(34) synthetase TilS [Prevotella sp.]|nr:tRNA lysidine(34) synthetase TilS [Prevotella sp.]
MTFIDNVKRYIHQNNLLQFNRRYIVALSGGADSVCLLLILHQLGYTIEAAHCNFRLRGKESDRDEKFCMDLCNKYSIPFHCIHFDTKAYASLHKVSIEMAARDLRYSYFENLRKDINAEGICVAHHREDCVETVLINLVRGTGIHGLRGILPKNGSILRPLLNSHRSDIELWLKAEEQDFVTDSSNFEDDVQRNKIRLDIMPLLQKLNPSVSDNIYSSAQHVAEGAQIIDDSLEKYLITREDIICYLPNPGFNGTEDYETSAYIHIAAVEHFSSPEYLLYYILKRYGFSGSQAEQIYAHFHEESGKLWKSATHELVIDRDWIIVHQPVKGMDKTMKIPETGYYHFNENCRLRISRFLKTGEFLPSKVGTIATIDSSKVHFPLTIRYTKTADRFHPFGMTGSKLISDLLTDMKKNLFQKQQQLVILDSEGKVIWLAGIRIDDRVKITDNTKTILKLELE